MNRYLPHEKNVDMIEALLSDTLKPMPLRKEFVQQLLKRLRTDSQLEIENNHPDLTEFGLLILVSILGGVFLFITNTRTVVSFLGTLGLLQYFKHQMQKKDFQSPRSA